MPRWVRLSCGTAETYRHGRVALGGSPDETMRITVVVPEDGDEAVAREIGLARARGFCTTVQ
jgi:hypothetical protein